MTIGYLDDSYLSDIADAIRAKTGDSASMTVADMPDEIAGIPTGGGGDTMAGRLNGTLTEYESNEVTDVRTYAFYNDAALQRVSWPNCAPNSVMNCVNLFNSASALVSANLPRCTMTGTNMFRNCTRLTSVTLGSLHNVQDYCFNGCTALTTFNADTSSITSIGQYAFSGTKIPSIDCPQCTTLGAYAFQNCSRLISASLPSLTALSTSSFHGCSNLSNVTFSAVQSVARLALRECTSLEELDLPACVTFGENSGNTPLYGCAGLKEIRFGTSLSTLYTSTATGKAVFTGCTSLERVIIEATTPPTLTAAPIYSAVNAAPRAGDVPNNFDGFYVPDASVAAYQAASNWSTYASYIKPMSDLPTT